MASFCFVTSLCCVLLASAPWGTSTEVVPVLSSSFSMFIPCTVLESLSQCEFRGSEHYERNHCHFQQTRNPENYFINVYTVSPSSYNHRSQPHHLHQIGVLSQLFHQIARRQQHHYLLITAKQHTHGPVHRPSSLPIAHLADAVVNELVQQLVELRHIRPRPAHHALAHLQVRLA